MAANMAAKLCFFLNIFLFYGVCKPYLVVLLLIMLEEMMLFNISVGLTLLRVLRNSR